MFVSVFKKSAYSKALVRFNSWKNIFKDTLNNMSGNEAIDSLLDSHEVISNYIQNRGSLQEDAAVVEYLRNVKYPPIEDFPNGLEWFNVSEPLSFNKHLKGKVVLLDFFTYCCINCMHILPDLKELENEFSIEDGLVVVGVHSAKFDNEKLSKNILSAVQRYNIAHPVVNDDESFMWRNCDVSCWPTLVLLGPHANPIVMLMGEGHLENLRLYIHNAIEYYKSKNEISNHKLPVKSAFHLLPDLKGPLLFPGKITSYAEENVNVEWLAISDTGNNRILIVRNDGTLVRQIGGSRVGFKDGSLEEAHFNSPQGLVFQNEHVLYVADTENHAIRKIDLQNNLVTTITGTGEQGKDQEGGQSGILQEISSPWDLCIFKTQDLNVKEGVLKDVLLIANAGTHQIWAYYLEDTVWWKNRRYTAGTCVRIAGSGREENKNNQYPHAAAFAQPSGIDLCVKSKELYIADSESSSVRRLSLIDGKVSAVVGGECNPYNLFAFGDKDGKKYDAKLQHVLGLAMSKKDDVLFIADTYNHKIKKVDISSNTVATLTVPQINDLCSFNEPGDLCLSADGKRLYVADTNNHLIRILILDDLYNVITVENLDLKLKSERLVSKVDKSKFQTVLTKPISVNNKGGKLILTVCLELTEGLNLTSDAPQNWVIDVPNVLWSCVPNCGSNVKNFDVVISVPPEETSSTVLDFAYKLVTCTTDTCLPKNFIVRQPIMYSKDAPLTIDTSIKVFVMQSNVTVESYKL